MKKVHIIIVMLLCIGFFNLISQEIIGVLPATLYFENDKYNYLQDPITDSIMDILSSSGYKLVERHRLDAALSELKLGLSGLTENDSAEIGKLTGATYVALSSISQLGLKYTLSIRLVHSQTGEIISLGRSTGGLDDLLDLAADLIKKSSFSGAKKPVTYLTFIFDISFYSWPVDKSNVLDSFNNVDLIKFEIEINGIKNFINLRDIMKRTTEMPELRSRIRDYIELNWATFDTNDNEPFVIIFVPLYEEDITLGLNIQFNSYGDGKLLRNSDYTNSKTFDLIEEKPYTFNVMHAYLKNSGIGKFNIWTFYNRPVTYPLVTRWGGDKLEALLNYYSKVKEFYKLPYAIIDLQGNTIIGKL